MQGCWGAGVQLCRGTAVQEGRGAGLQWCRVRKCSGVGVCVCVQSCRSEEVRGCRGAVVQRCRALYQHEVAGINTCVSQLCHAVGSSMGPAVPACQSSMGPAVPGRQSSMGPAVPGRQSSMGPAVPGRQLSMGPAVPAAKAARREPINVILGLKVYCRKILYNRVFINLNNKKWQFPNCRSKEDHKNFSSELITLSFKNMD